MKKKKKKRDNVVSVNDSTDKRQRRLFSSAGYRNRRERGVYTIQSEVSRSAHILATKDTLRGENTADIFLHIFSEFFLTIVAGGFFLLVLFYFITPGADKCLTKTYLQRVAFVFFVWIFLLSFF